MHGTGGTFATKDPTASTAVVLGAEDQRSRTKKKVLVRKKVRTRLLKKVKAVEQFVQAGANSSGTQFFLL
jgi:hypothetical protein